MRDGSTKGVKAWLDAALLAPLRNPKLRSLHARSLRGRRLLHGPPGCGKTFIARALAGELDATFLSISITDILFAHLGASEGNMRDAFRAARDEAGSGTGRRPVHRRTRAVPAASFPGSDGSTTAI